MPITKIMHYDDYKNLLESQWLSEKESLVYLCLLQLWSAPASVIARRTSIKRVTVYSVLKDLERKQIASCIEKKWVSYFQVIDPLKLFAKTKEKHQLFEEKIPELLALTNIYHNKPKIEYFEWYQWLKEMYDDLLTSKAELYSFLGVGALDRQLQEYLETEFLPRRVQNKVFAKVMIGEDEQSLVYKKKDKKNYRETRIVKQSPFELSAEINLYGPWKVGIALFSSDEMSALVIHSPKLYDTLVNIFNVLRSTAETSNDT